MITSEEYARMKTCSRTDGALVGVMWAVSFICMIAGFRNPSWSLASMLVGVVSPFYGFSLMRKFCRNVLGDNMGIGIALGYAIMMLLCATLILAGIQLIYFQFIDHGYFIECYGSILRSPEMAKTLESYGLSAQDIDSTITVISEMRPIEVVIQFLAGNVILSVILSIPLAMFAKKNGGQNIHDSKGVEGF
ncbi:DUF4199 domain-containing protein [Prevotella sp. OH937_COT-195]|uniref:DUF4199 domain-containing protein n=1 Tax=Prevotella sp. OH937_COT-195 TaxID=2491051 RepID=UPI000F6509F7|nr:DUF4199 domain-containing protein [Prevotella sp. OH937_COT-195]RRD03002.1 DUF4199 domain-containing protein [Prevotella sp. OH937_COT-195]